MAAAFVELDEDVANIIRRRRIFNIRTTLSTFNNFVNETDIISRYRLDRHSINEVKLAIEQDIKHDTNRSQALTPETQVLLASFAWLQELQKAKEDFHDIAGMPNVVAIDGTLIPILAPKDDAPAFVCRKQFHALNVQAVCDANLRKYNEMLQRVDRVARARTPSMRGAPFLVKQEQGWSDIQTPGDPGLMNSAFLGESDDDSVPWDTEPKGAYGGQDTPYTCKSQLNPAQRDIRYRSQAHDYEEGHTGNVKEEWYPPSQNSSTGYQQQGYGVHLSPGLILMSPRASP
ncbi:HARBI1 [Mytilus coruscus]|uniref:HARBI1 n=1 Tax=Mytilus coruscus TaxID=42192 RepID=A0A6J8AZU0_MYTCO|nr:HARBI1 [Mytilus coruscus]